MKINKKLLILTSLVIFIPSIIGLILWNQLPEPMATHFNSDGIADGYSSKLFAVLALPLFILFIHLACLFVIKADPKNKTVNSKVNNLIMWMCPMISLIIIGAIYPYNLGYEFNSAFMGKILISFMFIIIGNYLPKCRQNYTIGIKIPWTLSDEDNWNKTHRLAGKLWVIGGLVLLILTFIRVKLDIVFICFIFILILIPCIYSYLLYRSNKK